MKMTTQCLRISAVTVILLLVTSVVLAAERNIHAPKQPALTYAGEIIQCPDLNKGFITASVQNPPQGWKALALGSNVNFVFNSADDFQGGVTCVYDFPTHSTPTGQVRITRPPPAGKHCKAIDKKYFVCQ